jgi:hypothetical protein
MKGRAGKKMTRENDALHLPVSSSKIKENAPILV